RSPAWARRSWWSGPGAEWSRSSWSTRETPSWSTSRAGADASPHRSRGRTRPAGGGAPPSPPSAALPSELGDDLGHELAHLGGVAADAHAGRLQRLDLGLRGALRPRDDRARVAHLLAGG